ncbi:MAG: helix-turn-helix transcriptional regulator, partial [Ottowia sp.]|nr:helix-turn-helix transcriptional regulator [Ottowia sp.]
MTKNATTPGNALAYRTLLLGQSEDAGLRKGPRTQARIRWAACELLEGMSLDALTVQDIGRQAGIAQGTLYQYFGSRNELVAAVLHDFIAFLRERMLAAAAGSASFQDSVTRSTRTYC